MKLPKELGDDEIYGIYGQTSSAAGGAESLCGGREPPL